MLVRIIVAKAAAEFFPSRDIAGMSHLLGALPSC